MGADAASVGLCLSGSMRTLAEPCVATRAVVQVQRARRVQQDALLWPAARVVWMVEGNVPLPGVARHEGRGVQLYSGYCGS